MALCWHWEDRQYLTQHEARVTQRDDSFCSSKYNPNVAHHCELQNQWPSDQCFTPYGSVGFGVILQNFKHGASHTSSPFYSSYIRR